MKAHKSLSLAFIAMLGIAGSAHASLLDGKTINYQYYYPDSNTYYSGAANGNYVVGPGVEVSNVSDGRATLDISDHNLYIQYDDIAEWNGTSFNGFEISDVFGTIDAFTGVSINAATNLAGLDPSRITFDSDHIWVNWEGLTADANTVVSLDIESNSGTVPEPASLALIGLGLLGTAAARRKSAKSSA